MKEVNFLDVIDGDVDQADPREVMGKIAVHIRRIQPRVVSFSMDGHYGHPGYLALVQFACAAILEAADGHRVSKYYHMVDSKNAVAKIKKAIGGIGMRVDEVERNHVGGEEWAITTRIDAREYSFDVLWKAVLCHQSQLPGYGPLVDLPRETLMRFWGVGTFVRIFQSGEWREESRNGSVRGVERSVGRDSSRPTSLSHLLLH